VTGGAPIVDTGQARLHLTTNQACAVSKLSDDGGHRELPSEDGGSPLQVRTPTSLSLTCYIQYNRLSVGGGSNVVKGSAVYASDRGAWSDTGGWSPMDCSETRNLSLVTVGSKQEIKPGNV
jgi:hypothetical protein